MTIQQLLWQGAQILNKAGVPDEALDARYLIGYRSSNKEELLWNCCSSATSVWWQNIRI